MNEEARAWHGLAPRFVRRSDGRASTSLRSLAPHPLVFDPVGIAAAWGLCVAPDRTVLASVGQRATGPAPQATHACWQSVFAFDVAEIAVNAKSPVLALGGGLDAAVVLLAWRHSGRPMPAVVTLELGLPDYDEVEPAVAVAAALGLTCDVVSLRPDALVQLLPRSIAAMETPLYNLHPVTRFAMALELSARGHDVLVTGDGADAAFAGRPDLDYVPLVSALTSAAGMTLDSPFLRDRTLAAILAEAPDPQKSMVRAYAMSAGLSELAARPKMPRHMPALDVERFVDRSAVAKMADSLGLPADLASDEGRVGWSTLCLLATHLEAG